MFTELDLDDADTFYKLINIAKNGIYWKDKKGRYIGCNDHLLKIVGLTHQQQIIGKTEDEFWNFPKKNISGWRESDKLALKNGYCEIEVVKIISDEKKLFSIVKTRLINKSGNAIGILGSLTKITGQISQEAPETFVEQIINTVNASIYWKDKNGYYLGCNKYMLNMAGIVDKNQITGKTDNDLVWKTDAAQLIKIDQNVINNGRYAGEEILTIANGTKMTVLTVKNQLRDSEGNVIGLVGASLDITIQKEAERLKFEIELHKTAEKEHQMTQIIDLVNASIYWKDKEGRYLGCNKYVMNMAGVSDRSQIIGKTDAELVWSDISAKLMEVDSYVINQGRYTGEEIMTLADGSTLNVITVKNQLINSNGDVVGVIGTSLDITAQKEAERLRLESEMQKVILQEKENFAQLARKVAHDINSPLSALKMMIPLCDGLPENQRISLIRATERIVDIANNLLSNFRHQREKTTTSEVEPRQSLLLSDVLNQLLSEKKAEYGKHSVRFIISIADDTQFAFIQCQSIELRRAMSNLINNAVDALEGKSDGLVTIELTTYDNKVVVEIADNGFGMPSVLKERMRRRESFTTGKENRHGLGLQQVWDTLAYNEGEMDVQSTPRQGTTIKLVFAIIAAPDWIAQNIHLTPYSIILMLDDDESIHSAWNLRFASLLTTNPTLRLHHFTQGQEMLDFLAALSQEEKDNVVFLSDYELLHQNRNGLQIIEESEIDDAILVTSYYFNPQVQEEAKKLKVKILPKQMASIIPIYID